jgi:hypothetical protein
MISEKDTMALLREGRLLTKVHTPAGMRWFVMSGGRISNAVAQRILTRQDMQPHDGGLFPKCEQTFRMCMPKSQKVR